MIFKYPYTNLYNLNLDWIIQAIKEMQETIGPLDNIVNTFNDRTGNVELTAEDVNATLIDIVWTSDPGETVHDLTQTQIDQMYASGKRILIFVNNLGVADQVYFLQWYDNHAMPQEYTPTSALAGVVSFNGMTGNVVATGDNIATSATDTDTIAESLAEKVPMTRAVNGQPLSSNVNLDADDIPSEAITGATTVEMALGNLQNSKVPNARTVNGKSLLNNIVLDDADIPSTVDGKTDVEEVLEDHSDRIAELGPVNNVTSDSTTAALAAAQGKALSQQITELNDATAKLENVAIAETIALRDGFTFIGWLGWSGMKIICANPSLPFIINPNHNYTVEIRNNIANVYNLTNGSMESLVGNIGAINIDSIGALTIHLSQASSLGNNTPCCFYGDITIKRAS